ncbi:twitchin-like isoform X3 [Paramacrobiotus metropolitanus]|uniref:twitchin-like isoform X3 n=1 Tax=Paramacrobiotus metropolitanus TaxID=2943436 RepID=UPI002446485E|nr:twitchin-like isoform X3 [Paramacrobiotus metropolitanus]
MSTRSGTLAPVFVVTPQLHQEARTVTVECQVKSDPAPDAHWYRDNQELTHGGRVIITSEPLGNNCFALRLVVSNVVKTDAGLYKIVARNRAGEVSASVSLKLDKPQELIRSIDGIAPTFAQKPSIKQEDDGNRLLFECRVLADPTPTFTWFHDDKPVNQGGRFNIVVEPDGNSYFVVLEIDDVGVEDAGKYRVTAKNSVGENSANISLNFDSDEPPEEDKSKGIRPSFTQKPVIRQSDDFNKIIFDCKLRAQPKPTISWFQGTRPLQPSAKYEMFLTGGEDNNYGCRLEIAGAEVGDGGEYKVVAKNDAGEGQATINLSFANPDDEPETKSTGGTPKFTSKPVIRQEGTTLIMECNLSAEPKPDITWFQADKRIIPDQRHRILLNPEGENTYKVVLIISDPQQSDAGQYRCNAKNKNGESNANIALNFGGQAEETADGKFTPKFTEKPEILPGRDGSYVLLRVRVKANPQPTVVWYLNSQLVPSDERRMPNVESDGDDKYTITLEIQEPDYRDGGTYKCTIKNEKGEINANLNLNIEAPPDEEEEGLFAPTFVGKPKIIPDPSGTKVTMEVKVRAEPEPKYKWKRDETAVTRSSRHTFHDSMEQDVFVHRLVIENPSKKDAGLYTCTVTNTVGEVNAKLTLNIEGDDEPAGEAPKFIQQPKITTSGERVLVDFIVQSDAKPNVSWTYKGEEVRSSSNVIIKTETLKQQQYKGTLEIVKITPALGGQYQVQVSNESGKIQGNVNLNVQPPKDLALDKPVVKKSSKKQTVVIQSTVTAAGQPDVTWYKGTQAISARGRYSSRIEKSRVDETSYNVFLEISEITEQDVGEYKVTAKHDRKEVTETVRCTAEDVKQAKQEKKEEEKMDVEEDEAMEVDDTPAPQKKRPAEENKESAKKKEVEEEKKAADKKRSPDTSESGPAKKKTEEKPDAKKPAEPEAKRKAEEEKAAPGKPGAKPVEEAAKPRGRDEPAAKKTAVEEKKGVESKTTKEASPAEFPARDTPPVSARRSPAASPPRHVATRRTSGGFQFLPSPPPSEPQVVKPVARRTSGAFQFEESPPKEVGKPKAKAASPPLAAAAKPAGTKPSEPARKTDETKVTESARKSEEQKYGATAVSARGTEEISARAQREPEKVSMRQRDESPSPLGRRGLDKRVTPPKSTERVWVDVEDEPARKASDQAVSSKAVEAEPTYLARSKPTETTARERPSDTVARDAPKERPAAQPSPSGRAEAKREASPPSSAPPTKHAPTTATTVTDDTNKVPVAAPRSTEKQPARSEPASADKPREQSSQSAKRADEGQPAPGRPHDTEPTAPTPSKTPATKVPDSSRAAPTESVPSLPASRKPSESFPPSEPASRKPSETPTATPRGSVKPTPEPASTKPASKPETPVAGKATPAAAEPTGKTPEPASKTAAPSKPETAKAPEPAKPAAGTAKEPVAPKEAAKPGAPAQKSAAAEKAPTETTVAGKPTGKEAPVAAKPGEKPPAAAKPGEKPAEAKTAAAKPGETKPAEAGKAAEKPGDLAAPKPAQPKRSIPAKPEPEKMEAYPTLKPITKDAKAAAAEAEGTKLAETRKPSATPPGKPGTAKKPEEAKPATSKDLKEPKAATPRLSVSEAPGPELKPPYFSARIKPQSVKDGAPAEFTCKVKGNPTPTVTWYKDDKAVEPSQDFIITFDGTTATFKIADCLPEDTGKISCVIKNEHGEESCSALLTVKGEDKKPATSKKEEAPKLKKVSLQAESEDELTTHAPDSNLLAPPAGASKLRPGEVADKRRRSSVDMRRQSVMEKVDVVSTPLKPVGAPGSPAVLIDAPPNVQSQEDATAFFAVTVEGNPAPEVHWFRGIREIVNEGRCMVKTDGTTNQALLFIKKARHTDEGKYRIVASNEHGTDEAEIQLFVSVGGEGAMDFRAMLLHRKYAKWGIEEEDPNWGDLKHLEQEKPQLKKREGKKDGFMKELADMHLKEGKDKLAHMECVYSKPNQKPKWTKGPKEEIFHGLKFRLVNDKDTHILEIKDPKADDSGVYMCTIGESVTKCFLQVDEPDPVIEFVQKLPKELHQDKFKDAEMTCKISVPKVAVKWTKNGQPIERGDKYDIQKDGIGRCILKIKKLTEADTGEYICRYDDKIFTKCNFVVDQPLYKFNKPLKSIKVTEKSDATLECEVDDANAEVKWLKKGKILKPDDRHEFVVDGKKRKLIIKNSMLDDEDDYECKTNSDSTNAEVIVEPFNKIIKGLKDASMLTKETINFEVEFKDPKAPVEWFKDGEPLAAGGRHDIKGTRGMHNLIIKDLKLEDAGKYEARCGALITSCKLKVEEGETAPKISIGRTKVQGQVGKPLEIKIPYKIGGVKPSKPGFHLLRNGKPVPAKDLDVVIDDGEVKVKLKSPQRGDEGEYTMKLLNAAGSDEVPLDIQIHDVPLPPENLTIDNITAESCDLGWQPPKDDGGSPVTGYAIEVQEGKNGPWKKIAQVPGNQHKFKVPDLENKKEYKFRIRALNDIGQSEPLTALKSIIAKNPYDEPGEPGKPEVEDWDVNRVDIKWSPPTNDGGAPIEKYIVEMKDKFSDKWIPAKEVPAGTNKASIDGLKEGGQYEFRVRAVNKAGPGNPSPPTKPVIAKARYVKPSIMVEDLGSVVVKAGSVIRFDVRVNGEPFPEIIWSAMGKPLKDNKRATIEISEQNKKTLISIKAAERADTGKYTLTVKNSSGEMSAVGEVVVLDKPSRPQGPLEVHEVTKDSAKLKFKKPEDDGGQDITHYEFEKQEAGTGNWIPCGRTKDAHEPLEFKVEGLTPNKKYLFRVKAANKEGLSDPLETTTPILAKNPFDEPGKPGTPKVTDWDKDRVDLEWTAPLKDGGAPIEKYIIEKRPKKSKDWEKAIEVPADQLKASVPDLKEKEEYEFRVRAVNKAGPGEPSDPTKPVLVKTRFLKPRIIRDKLITTTIKVGQAFSFDVEIIGEPAPTTVWELLGKELTSDANRTVEHKEYKSHISVKKATRADAGKYRITADNSSGHDEAEVEVCVLGRPSRPEGPIQIAETTDKSIKMKWKPPKDDGGMPVDHYLIEKQDPKTGQWLPAGKVPGDQTEFTADGLTPKQKYNFRVKAVNKEGESEPLVTETPVIAKYPFDEPGKPGTPQVTDYDKDRVDLKWTPPDKDGGSPIEKYIIEKKPKGSKDWEKAMEVPGDKTAASVTGLPERQEFEFRVVAVNKAGPGEPSDPTKPIITKPKHLKPRIDKRNLKPITIKAGQPFAFDVDIQGEPPPEKVWTLAPAKKGVPPGEVKNGGKVKLVNEDYNTKLDVKRAERSDAGTYTITATNESGQDQATVEVVVLDKPLMPGGPLEVLDVHAEHCNLKWNPPEDDGGAPIDHYDVEKFDVAQGRWVPVGKTTKPEIAVEGLEPGHQYKFRVKAVNSEGPSEELMTDKPTLAKNPYDPPGACGKPELTDWDKDHVDLKWTAPTNDGGAPIEKYIIEKKDKNGEWEKAVEVPADKLNATVPGLTEGKEYQFRVKAVNKGGPGTPSEATAPIIAKPRRLAPRIDRKNLETLKVKAGQPIDFDVNVIGEPPPTTVWKLKNKELKSDDGVKIDNKDYNTHLIIKQSKRSDTGIYTLVATNEHGKDEAQVEVVVLSAPASPEGPLKVADVRKDGCTLSWNKPEDDGGSDISHYAVEKMDVATGRWVPCGETDGTEFKVDGLQPDHQYKFRVKAVNKQGESEPLTLEKPITAKDPWVAPDPPGKVEIADYDKDHVDLKWQPPVSDGGAPVEKYVIEKKDKSGNWLPAAEVPGDQTTGTVPNLIDGQTYEFRVKAVNKAGPSAPSVATQPFRVRHKHLAPQIDKSALREIKIKAGQPFNFDVPVIGEEPPKKTWTLEGEALNLDKDRVVTNEEYKTKLDVKAAERKDSGMYTLTATNSSGTDTATVKVIVLDKPTSPRGPLDVTNVTKDGCHLSWKTPEDDGGQDISHYVVEKQDQETGLWEPVAEVNGTQADVTKLTPGHEYKFRVKAVNRQGESAPLVTKVPIEAKNPFDEPGKTGTPEVTDWAKDHVDLKWDAPRSDGGSPVEKYIIEKRKKNSPFWETAAEVPGDKTEGTAGGLKEGDEYEFRVTAVNKAGPGEPSDPSRMVKCKPRNLAPTLDMSALKDIKVKAGQPIRFKVPISGEPTPTSTWTINGKPLSKDERVEEEKKEDYVILEIKNAKRADKGKYTLNLENVNGTKSGTANVEVMDKPEPPQGPLNASDIHKDGCTLTWKAPEDDGGSEIIKYVVEKMDTSRGTWVDAGESPDCKIKVNKLTPNKEYAFRVKAVNAQGESIPLEITKPIIAKNPFDAPDAPGEPQVTDFGPNHVDLSWAAPESDGGAPIQKYIIEKKPKYSPVWEKAAEVLGGKTSGTVPNLTEGEEYEFRVIAVNEGGESEPSLASKPVVAKHRRLPPKIKSNLRDLKVKAGQPLNVEVEFVGAPAPEVVWKNGDKVIVPDKQHVFITNDEGRTKISIPLTERLDSGPWKLQLKNEFGTDEGTFNVTVMDKPKPPTGPLEVSDITKDSCKLKWKPPTDDGGVPLNGYVVEKRDTKRGTWVPVSTLCAGTEIRVPKLKEGEEYEFRVMAENPMGTSEPLMTTKPIVAKDPYSPPGSPGQPEAVETDRDHITIQWTPPDDNGGSPISGYDVERKDEKGRWVKVNREPVKGTEFTDDTVQPNKTYEYRVTAKNTAGPGKPSEVSKPIKAKPMKEAPKIHLDGLLGKDIRVRAGEPLTIEVPISGAPTPTCTWERDGKALVDGRNLQLTSGEEFAKLHVPVAKKEDKGKYKLTVSNPFGIADGTINVIVLDKPDAPEGPLEYSDVTANQIKLSWKKPLDNNGGEISGYVVEKCQVGTGVWEKVGISPTEKMTVKGLEEGKKYQFRVKAENVYGASEPLVGSSVTAENPFGAPDAPSAPEITDTAPHAISLKWQKPKDDGGSPIQGYIIEKREPGVKDEWKPVNTKPIIGTQYTVPNLEEGHGYEFRVIAVNDAGPGKPSKASEMAIAQDTTRPDAPDAPKVDSITKDSVGLSWNKPIHSGGSPITGYIVEKKGPGDRDFVPVNKTPISDTKFVVPNLNEGEEYQFRVKAVNDAGPSDPSKPVGPVKVEPQPEKPHIDMGKIKDIVVKAGETFDIRVPYHGYPQPVAEWTKADPLGNVKDVSDSDSRVMTKTTSEQTLLSVGPAKRSDTGTYKLTLKNRLGQDTGSVRVTVLDRPDKPERLRADEIEADSITLKWSPPKDDGGEPITNYVVEKRGPDGVWTKVNNFVTGTSCKVRNLQEGKPYDFRVFAENAMGRSDPCETEDSIKPKSPYGKPTAPGTPACVDSTPESISLQWSRPLSDGGSPITGYIVEKRDAPDGKWVKAHVGPVTDNKFTVTGLQENKPYEFRVCAVNEAGPGEYSGTSDEIYARPPPSAPKIDWDNFKLRDITVREGEPFRIAIPFKGSPVPTQSWTVGGKPLLGDDRVIIEMTDGKIALLHNKSAKRSDSGNYRVTLTNDRGSDNAACTVTVVSAPSPPKGPLEPIETTPESIKLRWSPPEDDGGAPITNYIVEKADAGTDRWVKVSSFVRSPEYDVRGLEEGKKYKFRVRAENIHGISEPLETEKDITAKHPFDTPGAPGRPDVTDVDSDSVSLQWTRPTTDGGSKILGYVVEGRRPGDRNWKPMGDALIKDTKTTIPNLNEGDEWEFRVRAKNYAGLGTPSEETPVVTVKPKATVPSPPGIPNIAKIGRTYVDLKWTKPKSDGGSKILGYQVEKREKGNYIWVKAHDFMVQDPEATILNLIENAEYEFRVYAINSAGRSDPSMNTMPVKVKEATDGTKPEILKKFGNITTAVGKPVKLTVEAVGKPPVKVKWLKNGREINPSGRVKMTEKDGVFTLDIGEVLDSDAGEYTCELSNPGGKDTCTAQLRIIEPPKIIRYPDEVSFEEGESAKIKVFFQSETPCTARVFHGKEELKETDRLKWNVFDDYVVILSKEMQSDDNGKYRIEVINESGSGEASFPIKVTGKPGPPTGPLRVSDITQHQATLFWRPPENDGGSKILNYVVERKDVTRDNWVVASSYVKDCTFTVQGLAENAEYEFRVSAVNENGQGPPLNGDGPIVAKLPFDPPSAPGVPNVTEVGGDFVNLSWDKPQSDGGGRLQGYFIEKREKGSENWFRINPNPSLPPMFNVANLIEDREYEFRIFAVNAAGLSPPSSNSKIIKVKDPNAPIAPEFIRPLKNQLASSGKSVTLECEVEGFPKPEITWYKGSRELYDSNKYMMTVRGNVYTLTISDVFGEDADEYSCRAVNKGGSKTSRADVVIKTAPKIHLPSRFADVALFDKGEDIILKIPFTGYPRPTAVWRRDNEQIDNGGHYSIETLERHAILTIKSGAQEDNGNYRLIVSNELGEDSCVIKVQVNDKPDAPRFPMIENIWHDSITLSWKPPHSDGGSPITNYIIEKKEHPGSSWIRAASTRCSYHTVTNLNPLTTYEFRILAENLYGTSGPSDATAPVTTKEDEMKRRRRKRADLHDGKKVRGKDEGKVSDYDKFVFDVYDKYAKKPVDIKHDSVYQYYDILEEIGVGAFGVVHRCREKATGNIFAAKFIPVELPNEKQLIRKEIDIMNQLHHNKLIHLHDAFEDDDEMVLIYEFMSGGELFERITADDYTMSEAEVVHYMRQICEAVKHMHENNIVHLDLKPENIMCQTRKSTNVKLIDFGLATKLDPSAEVKITTGTAEFAAPEIVDREPVGFYTDMWAVGVLAYVLLSGLSPFAGEDDVETLRNVKACDWDFEDEAFAGVSEEAKDFIQKLLVKKKEARLTAAECLMHPWLMGKPLEGQTIPRSRLVKMRNKMRERYGDFWDKSVLPIGHIANYSSLRKLYPDKHRIADTFFDRREAGPRFVIKPQSALAYEGQSTKFYCRVISLEPAVITWWRDTLELRQSVKYMKRYDGNDYYLIINRCKIEDKGEYIVKAESAFGRREEVVFLNVQPQPHEELPMPEINIPRSKKNYDLVYDLPEQERDTAPSFSFGLRHRTIQRGIGVKLLCCIDGRPPPTVKWLKDGREITKQNTSCNITSAHGVSTLEIFSCESEDAGTYTCMASNSVGDKETSCKILVQGTFIDDLDYLGSGNAIYTSRDRSSGAHGAHGASPSRKASYSMVNGDIGSSSDDAIEKARKLRKELEGDVVTPRSKDFSSVGSARDTAKASAPAARETAKPVAAAKTEPDNTAPKFTQKLRAQKVTEGASLLLEVKVTATPEPKVVWTKDGQAISKLDVIQVSYKSGVASLAIAETLPEDAGEYVCRASNSEGSDETSCIITVDAARAKPAPVERQESELRPPAAALKEPAEGECAPVFTRHLQSANCNDGDALTLECQITGQPAVDAVWLHNDREIKPSDDFKYVHEGDVFKLQIAEIFPEDFGTYTCEAFNAVGEASSSCSVIVEVPGEEFLGPRFLTFPQSITVEEGSPAKFEVKINSETPVRVEWCKVNHLLEESDRFRFQEDASNVFRLEMPTVLLTDVGLYMVKATNENGESSCVFTLHVKA